MCISKIRQRLPPPKTTNTTQWMSGCGGDVALHGYTQITICPTNERLNNQRTTAACSTLPCWLSAFFCWRSLFKSRANEVYFTSRFAPDWTVCMSGLCICALASLKFKLVSRRYNSYNNINHFPSKIYFVNILYI